MAIELRFSKPDVSLHWGFRLVGGSDFNEPLVVVKVNENSIAENAGLMVGDVVVRVNNVATAGITHAEAHDLINEAGCDFIMAIRRGLFSDIPVPGEANYNTEVENIIKQSLAEQFEDTDKDQEIGHESTILENLAGQEQLIDSTKLTSSISETTTKNKKYSTFLVKPRNPKPVSKQAEEDRKKLGEPYKVKIVKQPRRDPKDVLNRKKTVQFEPNVIEVEISRDTSIADSTESLESEANFQNDMEMEVETSVQISEETTVEICEAESDEEEEANSPPNSSIIEEDEAKVTIRRPIAVQPIDIHIDPVICESSLTLEQQLAAVQKQLLALSQLPSAIQVTLEAVTQQLNKIVLEKIQNETENEVENIEEEIMVNGSEDTIEDDKNPDESQSLSENAEGDITETETEDQANVEELESDTVEEDDNAAKEDVEPEEPVVVDPYAGLTEEEKEAKLREEQLLAKKQKMAEARRKMDWTQRPIVLPGGRKWSDPEDATPKPKSTKMSDEKICKTLDDYSEVIVGKTKGSTIGTKFGRGARE